MLVGLIGVVAPSAGARLQLIAGLVARRVRHAVLDLARIGGRAEIDVKMPLRIDDEGMHRMIGGKRQAGDDDLRLFRHQRIRRQRVANDLVVLFDVERAVVEADAGAAGRALLDARAEALDDIGLTISFGRP
jgi:hypothetical protein